MPEPWESQLAQQGALLQNLPIEESCTGRNGQVLFISAMLSYGSGLPVEKKPRVEWCSRYWKHYKMITVTQVHSQRQVCSLKEIRAKLPVAATPFYCPMAAGLVVLKTNSDYENASTWGHPHTSQNMSKSSRVSISLLLEQQLIPLVSWTNVSDFSFLYHYVPISLPIKWALKQYVWLGRTQTEITWGKLGRKRKIQSASFVIQDIL